MRPSRSPRPSWWWRASTPMRAAVSAPRAASRPAGSTRSSIASWTVAGARKTSTPSWMWPGAAGAPRSAPSTTAPSAPTSPTSRSSAPSSRPSCPMPKLTIDGREIEVSPGTNLIEAARLAGVEIPHYCYHPGLSVAGQCRLCMVDIEKAPRPTIACNTQAADGMVVLTQTDRVLETRKSIMEFHLINHPLDCPVCDQAGECYLQIYYMKHALYDPRMVDEKVHKPKAVPLGPHVILDAERCILCSRCVRFCDEITKTGELGIFNRGDHSEIGLFPGHTLENKYSGNVVDICPVGALTDRDFRFQVRVWYLDSAPSVCPGCARGCNIDVHVNRRRPHHADGRRVARLKPRFNAAVNRWWLCDAGRYGFHFVDDRTRLARPRRRVGAAAQDATWDEALAD